MSRSRRLREALSRRTFLGCAAIGGAAVMSGAKALAADELAKNKSSETSSLQWLDITSERFPGIVKEVEGVCVVPWGCIERHGPHLPLGTDTILPEAAAIRAVKIEPAVVFPGIYYGQIAEARHCAGTISLNHDLLLRLLRETFDEIARNGFTKIMVVSGHGGNLALLDSLLQSQLQERRKYLLYAVKGGLLNEDEKQWKEMAPSDAGHAGVVETSCIMHVRPDTVHMEDLRDPSDGEKRGRLNGLNGLKNSFSWYADYPTQLAGTPPAARPDLGEFWVNARARFIADKIKRVKKDTVSAELADEFYNATNE